MSLLRPKDDDYIMRGLILLVVWIAVGMPTITTLAILAFHGPAGSLGIPVSIALGIWGYWAYLNWGLRNIAEKNVDEFAELIADRRRSRGLPRG